MPPKPVQLEDLTHSLVRFENEGKVDRVMISAVYNYYGLSKSVLDGKLLVVSTEFVTSDHLRLLREIASLKNCLMFYANKDSWTNTVDPDGTIKEAEAFEDAGKFARDFLKLEP